MKYYNTTLDPTNPILLDLLGRYPYFFSQNKESIHYKYHNTLAGMLNILKHDMELVSLAGVLDRPLKIWRLQTIPQKFTICYQAELTNIKKIKIYQEQKDGKDTLLVEKKFDKGTTNYTGHLSLETEGECIPSNRYYLEVETIGGLVFQKGFPENDTHLGDIYDQDTALDVIGRLYNLPRREYKAHIPETDYPHTQPPFCTSQSEWDHYYERRLQDHVKRFGIVPYYMLVLESVFGLTPHVTGRWRQVAHMEHDNMETGEKAKYMASNTWNNNVYDVYYDLGDLPRNLVVPGLWDIQKILDETFPIGSKIFFKINEEKNLKTQIRIKDNLNLELTFKDHVKLSDTLKWETGTPDIGY